MTHHREASPPPVGKAAAPATHHDRRRPARRGEPEDGLPRGQPGAPGQRAPGRPGPRRGVRAGLPAQRHRRARCARSEVSRTIGLLIEEIANPFYAAIAGVAAEIAAGHDTLLHHRLLRGGPGAGEGDAARRCASAGSTACSWCRPGSGSLVPAARRSQMGIPVVFLDRPPGPVAGRHRAGRQRGRRRSRGTAAASRRGTGGSAILLDSLTIYTMRERLGGAQAALAAAGVPYDDDAGTRGRADARPTPPPPSRELLDHAEPADRRSSA